MTEQPEPTAQPESDASVIMLVHWVSDDDVRTRWHVETPTLHDELGRTGCGKRYERSDAFYRVAEREQLGNDLDICDVCWDALRSTPKE